ncbi:MAG: ABC transporter permease [Planctomycetes bacterium]|nr:ABC transporter permease [Planctomycetota bacterium]
MCAAGDGGAAPEAADAAKERARARKRDYAATPPGPDGEPGEGKQLVPKTIYPLFASLSPFVIFMMSFWFLVLLWPLWNRLANRVLMKGDRERIRKARRTKTLFMLGAPALFALVWFTANGAGGGAFAVGPYKTGLTNGDIVAFSEPVFPPFSYGFAETHTEESFRPPTWTKSAEITEEGYYADGFRVPKADPITGYKPPPTPTLVRYSEPERNAAMRHPMGTDELGRDFFVRLLWGGQVSLSVGILSALLLTLIGVVMGSFAGYFGGRTDVLIMRLIEVLQSIPAFFLILVVMAFTDPEVVPPIVAIVVVIALVRWTGVARLVRGEFMRLREAEFVLAANALGFRASRTIFRHVLPNALSPIIVSAAFSVAAGILTESAISFLGFGIQHPGASWGSLVNESRSTEHWWVQVFPGLVIFLTVTCYNLAGDALRDALDPKLKD